jgi:hypothetical protein
MIKVPSKVIEAAARKIAIKRDCNDGRMCMADHCSCRTYARLAISTAMDMMSVKVTDDVDYANTIILHL